MTRASAIPGHEPMTPLQAATVWRMRMNAAEWSARDQAAFDAWLAEDEFHARAFERTGEVWDLVDSQAATPDLMVIRRDALHRAQRTARGRLARWTRPQPARRAAIAAAVAGFVALAGLGAVPLLSPGEVYQTGLNERRVVVLDDGSKLSLDAMTRVTVDYSDEARRLTLKKGQARFDVARDLARPFSVRAGDRTVVATGTAFNIDVFGDEARVTLIEGRVVVMPARQVRLPVAAPGPKPPKPIAMLPGQQLVAAEDAQPRLLASVDIKQATAWQHGKLMFDNEPLGEAVERMNRYSERKILVGDAVAATIPVSGAFDAGNVRGFLDAVTTYLPVTAVDGPRGVTLRSAGEG